MRNNIRPDARSIPMPVPYVGGILSGQGMLVGAFFGVAAMDAAQNASVECETRGEFELTKEPALAIAMPIVLVDLDFASGPFRAWTGIGPLEWAGMSFEGVGSIGAVGEVEETIELRAVRLTLALSPVPQAVVDIALAERSFRLRRARLWGALLSERGTFVADPFPLWVGLMDTMEVVDSAEPRVSLSCESRLVDLERAEVRRYTDADQQAEYPGDRFFEYVPALQEAEIRLPAR